MHTIRISRNGPVASLVIDRPDRRNALTQEMWDAVPRLLEPLRQDSSVRLLTVRSSTAGVFCAGADVVEYRDNAGDVEWGQQSQRRVETALQAIRSFEAPTLAVVDGACVGGGGGIALACDFRLASVRSIFGFPPAKLGLVFPIEDTVQLVRLLGPSAAKRLLFTGSTFDAEEARSMGFLDAVCEVDELESLVDSWTQEITATAPGSVRSMKRIVGMVLDGLVRSNEETEALVAKALRGAEHKEGVAAFLERRRAVFTD